MITRERISVSREQHPDGGVAPYMNVAAYQWHHGSEIPDRPDAQALNRWPIIAAYQPNLPSIVWFYDGKFRARNGYAWSTPPRWAYYRGDEEIWNPAKQQWEIPGLSYTAPPVVAPTGKHGVHMNGTQGQWMVDDMKRSFTTTQIQDMMDASPYDEPDTGAPEAL